MHCKRNRKIGEPLESRKPINLRKRKNTWKNKLENGKSQLNGEWENRDHSKKTGGAKISRPGKRTGTIEVLTNEIRKIKVKLNWVLNEYKLRSQYDQSTKMYKWL